MKILKSACFVLSLFAMVSISFAQFTITLNNVPAFGVVHTFYATQENTDVAVGPAGANQTWAIPEVAAELTGSNEFVDPAPTPFFNSFPTATHAFRSMNEVGAGDGYSYTRIVSDGAHGLGSVAGIAGQEVLMIYENESLDMPFPATYGTQWTSVSRSSYSPIAGLTITITDSILHHIDGWGTLNNQFGTYNVLREASHRYSTSLTEMPPLPPSTTEVTLYFYEWITQNGIPVTTMWSDINETNPNFTHGGVSFSVAGPVAADPIRGPVAENFSVGQNYPNPFNPTTSLPISLEKSGTVEIIIYNELGAVVASETRSFGPGNHSVGFDGSAWASGTYFANVKIGAQQETRRMTLVK